MFRLSEVCVLRCVCLCLMLAGLWPVCALALTLDEVSYGEHVSGPNLSPAQMRGKVVLVDLWGVECPPCIAQMPGFQSTYSQFKDEGFHVVALERQRHAMKDVIECVQQHPQLMNAGLAYQITGGNTNVPGRYTPFLPANFLFGPDGNMVATDVHGEVRDAKIRELLRDTWTTLIETGEVVKFKELASRLKTGQNLIATLSQLALRKRDSSDPAEVAEATRLMFAVFAAAGKKFEKAQTLRAGDPLAAFYKFDALARDLQGTQIAEKARTEAEALRNSDRVQKELNAEAGMKSILTHIADFVPGADGSRMPDSELFREANREGIRNLEVECRRLYTLYPGTTAGEHVHAVANDFRLNLTQ